MKERIAVLAGTPVDTQMGVDFLAARGLECTACPMARDPWQQTAFQYAPQEEKRRQVRRVLEEAQEQGCGKAFVYCNSLSGAVDFTAMAAETGMRIVTPLEVYRRLAPRYRVLAVIAANAQGLSGIERVLLEANPALEMLGACDLAAVAAVERAVPPGQLVERRRLPQLAEWFSLCGAEALVLGCTHFPYFKGALAGRTQLPLIDPAEEMFRLLAG